MVKASYLGMQAVQEFLAQEKMAQIKGWNVMGASKRGWLTYLVAATKCDHCGVNIKSISPLVPIVPDILKDVHRQFQSYNAFTFALI